MNISHIKIQDIILTEQFIEDWEAVENEQILKAVDKIIRLISCTKRLPNSMQAHKVQLGAPKSTWEHYWIGYVTLGNQAWRILFSLQKKNIIQFERLLPHAEMDRVCVLL